MVELPVSTSTDPLKQAEEALERWAQGTFADEPVSKLFALVGVGSWLFYKAEVGKNKNVNSIWDAMTYVSACTSVGHGNILPETPVGKMVSSFVMTIGPAMANAALTGGQLAREQQHREQQATQQEILTTMQSILAELKKQNTPR
jgi:hypothetical protein